MDASFTTALTDRFEANGDMIVRTFTDVPAGQMHAEPRAGVWSAHANLAHIGQFHDVIEGRVRQMLGEDDPRFERFVPDTHPDTAAWMALPTAEVLERLLHRRAEFCGLLRSLTPAQWTRTGTHSTYGTYSIAGWLEFWVQHDSHHVFVAIVRSRTSKQA